jgi:AraC-like DNA-binding protein
VSVDDRLAEPNRRRPRPSQKGNLPEGSSVLAVGEPPLAYLARWRMHLAAHYLKHSTDTVESIARALGYSSEYAFNRAFARHRGQPPGRYRRQALRAGGHSAQALRS